MNVFLIVLVNPFLFIHVNIGGGLAKNLNVNFIYVQQHAIQSKITYTCGSWCLLYLYMKSKNIKNINKKIKFIKNDKIKLKNDIKLKKKKLNTFGENIKTIYTKNCKQNNKKCNQRCNNFINSFLK